MKKGEYVVKKRISIFASVDTDKALEKCAKDTEGIRSKNMMAVKIIEDHLKKNQYLTEE